MRFFERSKTELEKFKNNAVQFFTELRYTEAVYFGLLVKKHKTDIERVEFKKARRENFKLSVFVLCWLAPIPFFGTLYFVVVPRAFWPDTLKRVLFK